MADVYPDLRDIAPARVLFAGDWHKRIYPARKVIEYAHSIGVDVIVHVGDLGYNYDSKDGRRFDKPLRLLLEEYKMLMVWIDGNHENHAWLRSLPVREDGFVRTGKGGRLFWAPRGHRWMWSGVRFGALGGAFSVNFPFLTEGKSWFMGVEEVQDADVRTLGGDKLDVLLTHDVPLGVPVRSGMKLHPSVSERSSLSRWMLRHAVDATRPEHVFSGHWHQRLDHDIEHEDGSVSHAHVLDLEESPGNIMVMDLFDGEVFSPPADWRMRKMFSGKD